MVADGTIIIAICCSAILELLCFRSMNYSTCVLIHINTLQRFQIDGAYSFGFNI